MKKIDFTSPYVTMSLVVLMYIIKAILKISIGSSINSVSIYSDGLHNLADLFEAGLLIFAIYLSKQPENQKYPLGKSSIESIGSFIIGLAIVFLGITFLLKSVLGLLIYFNYLPFLVGLLKLVTSPPAIINPGSHPILIIIVILFSIVFAWIVAAYEISVGKKKNHQSMVADGKETLADSFVEIAVLIGIIGALFGLYYLDFLFGILVAAVMLNTAKGVLSDSLGNLLQKSIDEKDFVKIKGILKESKGIESFEENDDDKLMAFKLGKFIFVSAKVYVLPSLTSEGFYYLRKGVSQRIKDLFPELEVRVFLKERTIKENPTRAIIPVNTVTKNKLDSFIEEDFTKAKRFFIVDLLGERIVSVKEEENKFKNISELAEFLEKKRVDVIYYVNIDKKLKSLLPNVLYNKTNFLTFKDLFH